MRIAFYIPYPIEGPSTRFRVFQFLPYLKSKGIDLEVFHFLSSSAYRRIFLQSENLSKAFDYLAAMARRTLDINKAGEFDLAFVQLQVSPLASSVFNRMLARSRTPIVFDFDDAQFLRYKSAASKFSDWLKSPNQTRELLRHSRHAIVGNRYLAEYAEKYCADVSVIPTCIDTNAVTIQNKREKDYLVIGWIGSSASTRYLKIIEQALLEILRRFDHVRIHIVGSKNYQLPHKRVKILPWSLENEIKQLRNFDIGLMPLSDEEYSKGKCGFKALQYMSVGVPAVISPIGVNNEIVQDGINGFHATSHDEWIDKLCRLIESADLRRELGLSGRKTVEKSYSVKVHGPRLLKILKKCK